MTTERHVMELFERANPVPEPDAIDVDLGAYRYLAALHEEPSTMIIIEPTNTPPRPGRRRWLLPAISAAVIVIVVMLGLVVVNDDDPTPADTPVPAPTTTALEQAVESPSSADTVAAYFATFNSADTDALLAMLAPDVIVTVTYQVSVPDLGGEPIPTSELELQLTWNHAAGVALTEPECHVSSEQPSVGTTLLCTYTTLDEIIQAVDGEPVPTRSWFTIVDETITKIHHDYGTPDFATLGRRFSFWMEHDNPEIEGADCCEGETREESVTRGELRAEWAQKWARHLEQNDCSPALPCMASDDAGDAAPPVDTAPPLPTPQSGATQASIVGNIT